jgi:hypothetical protein
MIKVGVFCPAPLAPLVAARLPGEWMLAWYGPHDEQRVLTGLLEPDQWVAAQALLAGFGMRGMVSRWQTWTEDEVIPQELLPPGYQDNNRLPSNRYRHASFHFSSRDLPDQGSGPPES